MNNQTGFEVPHYRVIATVATILMLVSATLQISSTRAVLAAGPMSEVTGPINRAPTTLSAQNAPVRATAVTPLVVTTTSDLGECTSAASFSLRCAIKQANTDCVNATSPCDIIQFQIPTSGDLKDPNCTGNPVVCTITPTFALPTVFVPYVTIDGYSQPGAAPNSNDHPLSQGDNASIVIRLNTNCLTLGGSHQTIQGLSLTGCTQGLTLSKADHAVIQGNFVGIMPDGTANNSISNQVGIAITDGSTDNTVGGTLAGAATPDSLGIGAVNVISNNLGDANVAVYDGSAGGGSVRNTIKGNLIGTEPDAITPTPYDGRGILALVSHGGQVSVAIGGTTMSGSDHVDANLIGGNQVGITVGDHATASIMGNYVGVTPTGKAVGNQRDGIDVGGGTATLGAPNDVSGAAANTIAENGDSGVGAGVVFGGYGNCCSSFVGIYRNIIFGNSQSFPGFLNIDLQDPAHLGTNGGVRCTADAPPAANEGMLCPVITSVSSSEIDGTSCSGCTVDVYIATNGIHDQNHGGARHWLGEVTADSCGLASCGWKLTSFATSFDPTQQAATATATRINAAGVAETSEFAADVALGANTTPPNHAFVVSTTADVSADTPCEDANGAYTATLRCAMSDANVGGTLPATDRSAVQFDIPPSDPNCSPVTINGSSQRVCRLAPTTQLPTLTGKNITLDGYSQPGASPNTNPHPLSEGDNAVILIELAVELANVPELQLDGANQMVQGLSLAPTHPGATKIRLLDNAQFDRVQGNFIGVTPDGQVPTQGWTDGVDLNRPAHDNTIGGSLAAGGGPLGVGAINVIAGNFSGVGFLCCGPGNTDGINNVVEGNLIGTNPAATAVLGNYTRGIAVGHDNAVIGGTKLVDGVNVDANLIGGQPYGIDINASANATIQGNFIGVGPTGTPFPNTWNGIVAERGSSGIIGGATAAAGNTIAHNDTQGANSGAGVWLGDGTSYTDRFAIERNTMFANNGKGGIMLYGQDPSTCTNGPQAGKPNDYTPCPVISSATTAKVSGTACPGCTVDVSLAASAADPEGKTWIGSAVAGACNPQPCTAPWILHGTDFAAPLSAGQTVVATATTPAAPGPAETSEFSAGVTVGQAGGNTLVVNTTQDLSPPCATNAYSLRCAISDANDDGSGDTIHFDIAGCPGTPAVCTIVPGTPLPALTAGNTVIDGYSQPSAASNTHSLLARTRPATAPSANKAVILIRLEGSHAGNTADGIHITGHNNTIRGLSIGQFGGAGIHLDGSGATGNLVAGNFVGLLPDGVTAAGNATGILEDNGATTNTIGGIHPADENVVSGNTSAGIQSGPSICSAPCPTPGHDVIQGNAVGTDAAGEHAVPNGTQDQFQTIGIQASGASDTIGGIDPGAGNLVSGNAYKGIYSTGNNSTIQGNYVGTNATGTAALGNGLSTRSPASRRAGLEAEGTGTLIGGTASGAGNLVSGNGNSNHQNAGLAIFGTSQIVQGNLVGTDATGSSKIPNSGYAGMEVSGGSDTVGGTAPGARNLVSGNTADYGIAEDGGSSIMQGNFIGTDRSGATALPNTGPGLYVDSGNDTVGGTASGAGNLISGNSGSGIKIDTPENTIQGNLVGTDATGKVALPNQGSGMDASSGGNTIGGTAAGAGNVISANRGDGIDLHVGSDADATTIAGNQIGVGSNGTTSLGNGANGIHIHSGVPSGNGVRLDRVAGNIVANNAESGVLVGSNTTDTTTHVVISRNSISGNGGLGIDLLPQGVVNCTNSPPGPNDYIHCPQIQTATDKQITGTACGGCTVEVFIAAPGPGDQGHGEGKTYLGSAVADANGAWKLLAPYAVTPSAGQSVTATATAPDHPGPPETSEFAANITVQIGPIGKALVVTSTGDTTFCRGSGLPGFTLRCATALANRDRAGDQITFNIPANDPGCSKGVCTISPTQALPALSANNTTIDGYSQPGAKPNTLAIGDNAVIAIRLDGSRAPAGTDGLTIMGANDSVDGLSVTSFQANGSAGGAGIRFSSFFAKGGQVLGNFVGLAPDGTTLKANYCGIAVGSSAAGIQIGSASPEDRNLIAGGLDGVQLVASSRNTIQGNYFGADRTGAGPVARGNTGIALLGEGSTRAPDSGDTIAGNVIGGLLGWGISAQPLSPDPTGSTNAYATIQGNIIGANAAGTASFRNVSGGIWLYSAHSFTVGGSTPGARNIIAASGGGLGTTGAILLGGAGRNNTIAGNSIGVGTGGVALPNQVNGIAISAGASGDRVMGNTIANNGGLGIQVGTTPTDVTHELISQNSLFSNRRGGISLAGQPADSCFFGRSPGAPNDYTPCPLVKSATTAAIRGEACAGCTVEVYLAPNGTDNEGKTLLGTVTAPTCSPVAPSPAPCSGITAWTLPAASYAAALAPGQFVTATASAPAGGGTPAETSQFSWDTPVGVPLTVNTTADNPTPCAPEAYSLRCAIEQANKDGAGDEIDFAIPAKDPGCTPGCILSLSSALPALTAPWTSIDGHTQPGSRPNTHPGTHKGLPLQAASGGDNAVLAISLAGTNVLNASDGLTLAAAHIDLEGLSIGGFAANGIHLSGTGAIYDIVAGDFLGVAADGATPAGNNNGVLVDGGASRALIGLLTPADANVISGNQTYGVELDEAGKNVVMSNLIGTTASGESAAGNGFSGVLLVSTNGNTIGGATTVTGNLISGNGSDGLTGIAASGTTIAANTIGEDALGNHSVPNGLSGVYLTIGDSNTIGGATDALGNAIDGNQGDGIDLMGEGGDIVSHNAIGYSTAPGPNNGAGVLVTNAGIETATARRAHAIPHTAAVSGGHHTVAATVSDNVISGNRGVGVQVGETAYDRDVHVLITRNRMAGNNGPGIQLTGSPLNCSANSNPLHGPNDNLSCPVIRQASPALVQGTACLGCTVEVFRANATARDQGYGEGEEYLGTATALLTFQGIVWRFSVPPGKLQPGQFVTAVTIRPATATVPAESSQFAHNVQVGR